MTTFPDDVASPIDLRDPADALDWEQTAMVKRPWRADFFVRFSEALGGVSPPVQRVLELGSGPGFLAEHLLSTHPALKAVLLDFSTPMHALARARLGPLASRAEFVTRSFKDPDWAESLGLFDAVVTNQTVHELRHKRHAAGLHAQVRSLLRPGAIYLVADHHCGDGGMTNNDLFMTVAEQHEALLDAGFTRVDGLLQHGGMVLHAARMA
ncbi:MAG: hypothetical protein RLZZ618_173 [Pseudomonadota bacterium]